MTMAVAYKLMKILCRGFLFCMYLIQDALQLDVRVNSERLMGWYIVRNSNTRRLVSEYRFLNQSRRILVHTTVSYYNHLFFWYKSDSEHRNYPRIIDHQHDELMKLVQSYQSSWLPFHTYSELKTFAWPLFFQSIHRDVGTSYTHIGFEKKILCSLKKTPHNGSQFRYLVCTRRTYVLFNITITSLNHQKPFENNNAKSIILRVLHVGKKRIPSYLRRLY